jgi:flagellar biosynthesis protein FliP
MTLLLTAFFMSGCAMKVVPNNATAYSERDTLNQSREYRHVMTEDKHYQRYYHTRHTKQNGVTIHPKRKTDPRQTKSVKNRDNIKIRK